MLEIERTVREQMGTVAPAPVQQPPPAPVQAVPQAHGNQMTAHAPVPVTPEESQTDQRVWRLGENPWSILNLIVGDAKTLTECQERINAFMRLPASAGMPKTVRNAIRSMGFQVPDAGVPQGGMVNQDNGVPETPQEQSAMPEQPMPEPVREAMGHILLCDRVLVREATGSVLSQVAPTAPNPDHGNWVTLEHAGVPIMVFISPGGTVTKGPAALIGANVKHLQPIPGERHMTHHPPGHIPPLADAQHSYSEHPSGSLPLKLDRTQSHQALVQAVHDVGTQHAQARSGQAERLNAALADQVAHQGSAAAGGQDKPLTSGHSPQAPLGTATGADDPVAGPARGPVGAMPGGKGGGQEEAEGQTDLVPDGEGTGPLDDAEDDGVPQTHRMQAWLMDHVMMGQPQLEEGGRFAQPNIVEDKLAEARTPPEQLLTLAHHMHLWHPAEGAPDEKVGALRDTVGQALDRAHQAGAISPQDRAEYEGAMGHLENFVQAHSRWPSSLEFAAQANARPGVVQPDDDEAPPGQEEQGNDVM